PPAAAGPRPRPEAAHDLDDPRLAQLIGELSATTPRVPHLVGRAQSQPDNGRAKALHPPGRRGTNPRLRSVVRDDRARGAGAASTTPSPNEKATKRRLPQSAGSLARAARQAPALACGPRQRRTSPHHLRAHVAATGVNLMVCSTADQQTRQSACSRPRSQTRRGQRVYLTNS